MEMLTLEAKKREHTGRQAKKVRAEGHVPAVVYGRGVESRNLSVESRAFDKVYGAAGDSSLIDLKVGNDEVVKVLVQDVQYEPLYHVPIHVDFRQVNMNEKLETDISLAFIGESSAVKTLGAILARSLESVRVRCLPKDLVHDIKVDLSSLKEYGDLISVGDITVPEGIEILNDDNAVIIVATEPVSEEELEASLSASTEVDVTKIENSIVKPKADDEEGAAEAAKPEAKK
jgi:large subunit ribosomal protein L25